jgi:hypothetical protein
MCMNIWAKPTTNSTAKHRRLQAHSMVMPSNTSAITLKRFPYCYNPPPVTMLSNTHNISALATPLAIPSTIIWMHTSMLGMLKTLVTSGQLKGKMHCGHIQTEAIHKLRQMFQHLRSNRRILEKFRYKRSRLLYANCNNGQ